MSNESKQLPNPIADLWTQAAGMSVETLDTLERGAAMYAAQLCRALAEQGAKVVDGFSARWFSLVADVCAAVRYERLLRDRD